MNLLSETLEVLQESGKSPEKDVKWVGSANGKYAITWKEFKKIASQVEYDNGYGGQEIANDLVVVGKNWWLERGEYDGSEWWAIKKLPEKQLKTKDFKHLIGDASRGTGIGWKSVEEMENP